MDKNKNILVAALYLKEASDLLLFELSDISNLLLKLTKTMLEEYKISNDDVLSALNIIQDIKNNS